MRADTTRRAMLGALAVAPVAGLPAIAAGDSSDLAALIEAHKQAAATFLRVVEEDDGANPPPRSEWEKASAAEEAAALALCAYRCATMAEARAKASYILSAPTIIQDLDGEPGYATAFIASLADVAHAKSGA